MTDAPKNRDDIPTDAELDALQAEIERVKAEPVSPAPREGREPLQLDPAAREAALNAIREAGHDPDVELPDPNAAAARVVELETELAALKDRALRAMADAENTKKRAEREVEKSKTFGIERFARDVLEVYDNLQRALHSVDDTTRAALGPNAQSLLEGIELTEKTLMAVLARHGVTAVAGVGEKFDPNVHQAVAQIPSAQPKNTVAEVMQTGFRLGDRTLRAAMVAVSTGPAA